MKPILPVKGIHTCLSAAILCFLSVIVSVIPAKASDDVTTGLFNTAPVATDDYAHLLSNGTVSGSYIYNDYDPDGDSLSMNGITIHPSFSPVLIQTLPTVQGGSISFFSNGEYTYTPAPNFVGNDQVVYQICDVTRNPLCATATVYIRVEQGGTILQVNLSAFSGKRTGNDNLLQWSTAQENNSDHFEVQCSTDNARFATIAFVKAKGNSTVASVYSFVHYAPGSTVNYYRLRLVDMDGSSRYSKVIAIKPDGKSVTLQTVYPDPFRDRLELAITMEQAGTVSIQLYDVNGNLVRRKTEKTVKGLNIIRLTDLANLPAGNYFITVKGPGTILQAKLYKTA